MKKPSVSRPKFSRNLVFAAMLALGAAPMAHAVVLTWDSDTGTPSAQDGGGTWTTGTGGWWDGDANANWAAADQAIFGAGTDAASPATYAITVGGAITTANGNLTTGGLNFVNSGYVLSSASAQTIAVGNATGASSFVRVASGKSAVIAGNVTVQKGGSGSLILVGGGTLEVASGGVFRQTFSNASEIAGGTTLRINGGSSSYATSLVVGQFDLSGNGQDGHIVVDSGSLTISSNNLIIGRIAADVSTCTVNGGTITIAAGNLNLGATSVAGTSSTVHLNGGTIQARQFTRLGTGTAVLNFNGGTIRAQTSGNATAFVSNISRVNIRNGGAVIDTFGQNLTVPQVLEHSNLGGDNAIDGGLTKSGNGTLTLSGANTFTGATTIQTGNIALGNTLALQNSAFNTTGSTGGVGLIVTGYATPTLGGLAGAEDLVTAITAGYGSVTNLILNVPSGSSTSYSGAIANGAAGMTLTKNGAGTQVLAGANSFTGNVAVNLGNLVINNSSALGTGTKTVTINATANKTLDLDASLPGGSDITLPATISFTTSGVNGTIRNISGNNTIQGVITMSLGNGDTKIISDGGKLTLAGNITTSTSDRVLDLSGTSLEDNTLSGVLNNASTPSLRKSGAGKWILAAANTFQGPTTITGGTLALAHNQALQNSPLNTEFTGGGSLDLTAVNTPVIGGFNGAGAMVLPANVVSLTLNPPSGTATYTGSISGGTGLSLAKSGTGTQVLGAANTFGGNATISAGVLNVAHNNALDGISSIVVTSSGSGGILQLANGVKITGKSITTNGWGTNVRGSLQAAAAATAEWAGTVILGNYSLDSRLGAGAGGVLLLSGQIQDGFTSNLIVSAENATSVTPGKVIVSGTSNTYTGQTQIYRGILAIGANNALPTGTVLNVHAASGITDAAQFDLNGYNQEVAGLLRGNTAGPAEVTNSGPTAKTLTINSSASWTFDSPITGNLALAKSGPGIQTLTATNSFSGGTTVADGILSLGHATDTLADSGAVNVTGGTLEIGANSDTVGAVTLSSGSISGSGGVLTATSYAVQSGSASVNLGGAASLTKSGGGTVTLTGANTYSGDTTVSAGILSIGQANPNNETSIVSIAAGATLNLAHADTDNVGQLVINGVPKAAGVWGSVSSGAPNTDDVFTGTGTLTVANGPSSTAYDDWAADKGLTAGVNDGKDDDPDGDGQSNLAEFGLDGDPLSAANDGKIVGKVATVGSDSVLTLTLPVRNGASFSGPTAQVSNDVDGLIYTVEGDGSDLGAWDLVVTEVTGPDADTIQADLPTLSDINGDTTPDWTYRTFRVPDAVGVDPQAFLRAKVGPTP